MHQTHQPSGIATPVALLPAPSLPLRESEPPGGYHPGPWDPARSTIVAERGGLKVRRADCAGTRADASYLVRKMYEWRGYEVGAPQGTPDRVTLMAGDDGGVLATITVGFDGIGGLMVEHLYRDEVERLRECGGRICEFTRLAVDRELQSKELLAMMFHIAYMVAHRLHGCTDLLIEVNPRHVRFYERMLGFVPLGETRTCLRVNAPARLMWLSLAHARDQIARFGGGHDLHARSLYPLFFSPLEENGIVARLRSA
jgi:hypothetical protein